MKMKGKNFGMVTAMVVMGMISGISCSGKEEEWPSFAKMAGGFGLSLGDDSLDGAVDEEAGSAQEDGGEEELLVTRKVQEEYPLLADEAENRCFLNRDDYITLQDMQKEGHYQVKAGTRSGELPGIFMRPGATGRSLSRPIPGRLRMKI